MYAATSVLEVPIAVHIKLYHNDERFSIALLKKTAADSSANFVLTELFVLTVFSFWQRADRH